MALLDSHRHLSLFVYCLRLHDTCFTIVFDSFILVIMLNVLRFKSSVLFGTHTLLDKSFRSITTSNTSI